MKKTRKLREFLKKIYKNKRKQDADLVGKKINDLVTSLHLQNSLPPEKQDKDVIKVSLSELLATQKESRFKEQFPSFASFYDYITDRKHGFTLEDIKEL